MTAAACTHSPRFSRRSASPQCYKFSRPASPPALLRMSPGSSADPARGWGCEKPIEKALFEPGRGWGLQNCPFGGVAGVKRGKGGGEKGGGRKGEKKGRGGKGGQADVFVFLGHSFGSPRVTLGTKTAPHKTPLPQASHPCYLALFFQGVQKNFSGGLW